MKTLKFPDRLKEAISSSYSFSQALTRLKDGKDATPRSWVYEHIEDPSEILKMWTSILKANVNGDLEELCNWDLSKSGKFAPQGAVAPFSERQHTLSEYWAHLGSSPIFQSSDWKKAKASAVRLLRFNRTGEPRPVDAIIQRGLSEDKYNTSSGDPLFLRRKDPRAIQQARSAAEDGTWDKFYPVLGSRASMGKTGRDARWIFMFPMAVNLKEQTFQQPLQDYIREKKVAFFHPWEGYDAVQANLSQVSQDVLKFGCDYSKMDQHFNLSHAEQVFDVVKEYFKPNFHEELWHSFEYTFNCSVVAPDFLLTGPHAMPSGSGWTNFMETVFNFILVQYMKIHYGLKISDLSMGIGDDQIWFISFSGDVRKLTNLIVDVFKECGLDANPDKQEVSYDTISFLQRRSQRDWSPYGIKYAGVYPTVRALTSEIYPEFYHDSRKWTKKTFALRCIMILENCKFHPAFEQFVVFISEGNANIVEFALSDDAQILYEWHQAKKIPNFLPSYNQLALEMNPVTFSSLKLIRKHFGKTN